MRTFETGATRDTDQNKLDFEGFLSPLVLERFAQYMDKHRYQADGNVRDSDNWQKGIPMTAYMKSGWRHFFDWWKLHRASLAEALDPQSEDLLEEALCAELFNVQGYLHEHLKRKQESDRWLFEQAVQQINDRQREQQARIDAVVEGVESVDDGYIPDLRPVSEGEYHTEPDPVTRGFAFHRHLEGNSPPVEPGRVIPMKEMKEWWRRYIAHPLSGRG